MATTSRTRRFERFAPVRHRLLAAVLLCTPVACGTAGVQAVGDSDATGSYSYGAQTTSNTSHPTATGTPQPTATPAGSATGPHVGFVFAATSASGRAHPATTPDYWSKQMTSLTAQLPGSRGGARVVVGTYDAERNATVLSFAADATRAGDLREGSGGVVYADGETLDGLLTALDQHAARVLLEVQPGTANLADLATLVLRHYAGHASVAGFAVDLSAYGRRGAGTTQLDDDDAAALVAAVQAVNGSYVTEVKHYASRYMPSAEVAGLDFVLDASNFAGLTDMASTFARFASRFANGNVGFVVGHQADQAWACGQSNVQAALLNAAAAAGDNVSGIYWGADTAQLLLPTYQFCGSATDAETSGSATVVGGEAATDASTGTGATAPTAPSNAATPSGNTATVPSANTGTGGTTPAANAGTGVVAPVAGTGTSVSPPATETGTGGTTPTTDTGAGVTAPAANTGTGTPSVGTGTTAPATGTGVAAPSAGSGTSVPATGTGAGATAPSIGTGAAGGDVQAYRG